MEITSTTSDNTISNDLFLQDETNTELKPWHQLVRDKISKQAYRYNSPQTSLQIDEFRENFEKKLVADIELLSDRHPETFVRQILEDDELTMPGLAILAAYLRQRKGLNNLFVCKSLEAFQKKLDEVGRLEGNARLALVLTDWPEVYDQHDKKDGEYGADITHKLAVCIEKTGPHIKIAILDPLGFNDQEISPFKAFSSAKDLKYIDLEATGYLLWYILHSSLNMKDTSIYYSPIRRQRIYTGCETFALTDGIAFLRDPHFFDNIQTKRLLFKEGNSQLRLHKITSLPPAFMTGTQSLTLLEEYIQENRKSPDPKKLQTIEMLIKKVQQHLIEVDGKLQNHYTNQKSIKYHLIAATSVGVILPHQLQQILQETLLTTPRIPGNGAPQTLSDLHHWKPVIIIEEDK